MFRSRLGTAHRHKSDSVLNAQRASHRFASGPLERLEERVVLTGLDLGLSLTSSAANYHVGDTVTYTMTVTNAATSPPILATLPVTVTDAPALGLTNISVSSAEPSAWSFSETSTTSPAVITGIYTGTYPIPAGATLPTITITGTATSQGLGVLANVGTLLDVGDVNLSNNAVTADVGVVSNVGLPTTLNVAPATGTYGGTTSLSATLTSAGLVPVSGETVDFMMGGTELGTAVTNAQGVATLSGVSLSNVNAGTYTNGITASFAGDSTFAGASGSTNLVVNPAVLTVSWPNPSAITYGAALTSAQLDATANGPGTFVYTPPAGTILHAGNQTLSVSFTPSDPADFVNYSGPVTQTATITVNKADPTVGMTWTGPATGITYGTALGPAQLNATSTVAGTWTYSPPAGTILHAGNQTLTATFTPTDTTDYATTTVSATIAVAKATPFYRWSVPADITYGTPLGATQLDATASVPGSFTYNQPAGTVLHAGKGQTLTATFTPTDTADYNTIPAQAGINVLPASLTVTANSVSRVYNTANPALTVSYSGFVNGDTASSLTIPATASTSAGLSSLPGLYAITASGASSPNYTISYTSGTLTVDQPSAAVQGDMSLIETLYHDLLNRAADAGGISVYTNLMVNNGWTPQQVETSILNSKEYAGLQASGKGTGISPSAALADALQAQAYTEAHPKAATQFS